MINYNVKLYALTRQNEIVAIFPMNYLFGRILIHNCSFDFAGRQIHPEFCLILLCPANKIGPRTSWTSGTITYTQYLLCSRVITYITDSNDKLTYQNVRLNIAAKKPIVTVGNCCRRIDPAPPAAINRYQMLIPTNPAVFTSNNTTINPSNRHVNVVGLPRQRCT